MANSDKKTLLIGTAVAVSLSLVLGIFEFAASGFITALETNPSAIFIGLYWVGCIALTMLIVYVTTKNIAFSLLAGFFINAVVQDFVSAVLRFGWPFPAWNHIALRVVIAKQLRPLAAPMPIFPYLPNYYWIYLVLFIIGAVAIKKAGDYLTRH